MLFQKAEYLQHAQELSDQDLINLVLDEDVSEEKTICEPELIPVKPTN